MQIKITTLKQHPEHLAETIALIETAFNYPKENSFAVDFHLLMNTKNFENCYLAVDENNKVLGHLGLRKSSIKWNDELHPIAMLGGIATDESARGKGIFKKLYNHIIEKETEIGCFFLWSDNSSLYNKFGFHLCGLQLEFKNTADESSLIKTKFKNLTQEEKETLISIYNKNTYPQIHRDNQDWEDLSQISSTDLFLQKTNNVISGYAFMNKGADLQNIVYESRDIELKELQKIGKVWSYTTDWIDENEYDTHFAYFARIGNPQLFTKLIRSFYHGKIVIKNVDEKGVEFYHREDHHVLAECDFLTGVFGPNFFEELRPYAKVPYISGIDSI